MENLEKLQKTIEFFSTIFLSVSLIILFILGFCALSVESESQDVLTGMTEKSLQLQQEQNEILRNLEIKIK